MGTYVLLVLFYDMQFISFRQCYESKVHTAVPILLLFLFLFLHLLNFFFYFY